MTITYTGLEENWKYKQYKEDITLYSQLSAIRYFGPADYYDCWENERTLQLKL